MNKKVNRGFSSFLFGKKGEFNFSLIFALVAGAAILVLAIYGAMKVSDTQRYQTDSEIAKKIAILTDPLQAGFAEGKKGEIIFTADTRINNYCLDDGFGANEISVSTRAGIGDEWKDSGAATTIKSKYIFSGMREIGKKFTVFSKQFYFPYKASDLIFLISEKYCFLDAPEEIKSEISGMNIGNIELGNCSSDSVKVCFGSSNCNINVRGTCTVNCETAYEEGYVLKNGKKLDYVGSLMYGAIFSDTGIYECNVKRLMYRAGKIAEGFSKKTDLMNSRSCNTNLKGDLVVFGGMALNASKDNLVQLNQIAKLVESKNQQELCRAW